MKNSKFANKKVLIKGLGACEGVIEGVVKIVFDPSEVNNLPPNTILVVPNTDPSWATLLLQAKGIITNTGNLLCHAAIVAREFEIPCIVGTINATEVLKNGQKILMDGGKGEVYDIK